MVREISKPPDSEYPRHEGEANVGYTEALGEHASNPATPGNAADVVFALGQEFRVSGMEQRIKAQFEQCIRRNALQGINEASELLQNPELSRRQLAAYNAERAAGAYNWDGSACRAARFELEGLRTLFHLLLKRCHPDISEETSAAIFDEKPRECVAAIAWAQGNPREPEQEATARNGARR